jgi:hypothetical protein
LPKSDHNSAPRFCSEADFQFALGWKIQKEFPNAEIRFECPALLKGATVEIDIVVKLNDELFPIELKNPTEEGGRTTNNRCDMVKDIERLENLQSSDLKVQDFINFPIREGFAVWLTDNKAYREKIASVHNCDIRNGVLEKGTYSYTGGTKEGEFIAEIGNNHTIEWKEYKSDDSSYQLWYSLIRIPK